VCVCVCVCVFIVKVASVMDICLFWQPATVLCSSSLLTYNLNTIRFFAVHGCRVWTVLAFLSATIFRILLHSFRD